MPKRDVTAGSTSISCVAFVQDSSSTIGAGLAGLTNATSGLTGYYVRNRGASTSFGFASLGSATAGWTSGGFLQIDSVGLKGHYRLDLPDACFASGSPFVNVNLGGAANMAQCPMEFAITLTDNQTAPSNTTIGAVARDVGGRVLGATSTAFSGVGTQADVEQWRANAVPATNVSGVPLVDLKYTSGTQVYNFDGTVAGATSITVTLPTLDSAGNAVPDSGQFAWHEMEVTGGLGLGQRVLLTTTTGTARQYNVLSGTIPLGADSTSTYIMHDVWRTNTALWSGTVVANPDTAGYPKVTIKSGVGTGEINLSSGKVPATLSSADVTGNVAADLQTIKTQTVTAAAGVTFPTSIASPTNITAGTITTVTTVGTVNALAANTITAASIAADADAEIAGAVWDLATAGHTTSGTFGAAMVAAGSAGDPWATSLPGGYSPGTAGYVVGNNINATISSRSTLDATGVWASGTRTLTSGSGIVLAKGIGVTGFNDVSAADILYTALTETYATAGGAFTLAQGLYEICQGITQFAIAGTVITVQKRDRGTTATTYTLDAAPPNATLRTRAT